MILFQHGLGPMYRAFFSELWRGTYTGEYLVPDILNAASLRWATFLGSGTNGGNQLRR